MSKWIRGIYNAAANFNMRNALQSASGRTLGGNNKQLPEESNESNQHVKSSEPVEPSSITADTCTTATCTCARTSSRNGYRIPCKCDATTNKCATSGSATTATTATSEHTSSASTKDGELPNPHGTSCTCSLCRDYNEYVNYTVSATREDISTWVRVSNESRDFKQADADSAERVERCTGIPTGVTV